jgi:hypothetical protein
MSVNVDLAQHGLSEAEQLAVFEFMNRGQQVRCILSTRLRDD